MAELVLVTGAAGFIGFHVAKRLVEGGQRVVGLDNLNAYYDPAVKRDRLAALPGDGRFTFEQLDLGDRAALAGLFERHRFPLVVHLAAQAGVRYSVDNPPAYADANRRASPTCSRDAGSMAAATSSMPRRPPYTGPIRGCRSAPPTMSTIP